MGRRLSLSSSCPSDRLGTQLFVEADMNLLLHKFARLSRSRRGSVLILCVVLIVVLALIGTAMLSRARIDRAAAVQHSNNTEVDMLVDGMLNIAQGVILADLYDNGVFRPGDGSPFPMPAPSSWTPPLRATTYDNWDAPSLVSPLPNATLPVSALQNAARNDIWLMPRIPSVFNEAAAAGPGNWPYWPSITAPLLGTQFDSPFVLLGAPHTGVGTVTGGTTSYTQRTSYDTITPVTRLEPDYVASINGTALPERLPVWTLGTGLAARKYLAGDADGDGIADCGLVKIPVGEINGLTYYAGFRIIDNGSAINLNTAIRRDADYDNGIASGPLRTYGYFPSNIGLAELLHSRQNVGVPMENVYLLGTEMTNLLSHRIGRVLGSQPIPGLGSGGAPPAVGPLDYDGNAMTSFYFTSFGDALSMQLANRLGRPGANSAGPNPPVRFQALSGAEAAALANPTPRSSSSIVQQLLPASLYGTASKAAYRADRVALWFDQNFDFAQEDIANPLTTFMPRRSILTTTNAVSNIAPWHNMALSPASGVDAFYRFDPSPIPLTAPWPPNPPDDLKMPNTSAVGSASTDFQGYSAARANVNTAYFGELWRAYWNVMVDQTTGTGTPFPLGISGSDQDDIYLGNRFVQWDFGDPTPKFLPNNAPTERHSQRMFRSSIRDPRPLGGGMVFMPASQQLLLRSAIAAVNTETMRDQRVLPPSGDVLPTVRRDIVLTVDRDGTQEAVQVEIFGYRPQPFITEVYASTQEYEVLGDTTSARNPRGYVAIELYNPYPYDISLAGWTLAVLDRRQGATTYGTSGLSFFYIGPTAGNGAAPSPLPTGTVIPPNGFLVLDNYSTTDPDAAKFRPAQASITGSTVFVPNLQWVIEDNPAPPLPTSGGELVLLRPVDPTSPPASLTVYEGIPVDSFDFSGLKSAAIETAYTSIHYVRSNRDGASATEPNWKFVYPGRYDARSNDRRRHQGTEQSIFGPIGAGQVPENSYTAPATSIRLGQSDYEASFPTNHVIPLSLTDQPGPNPPFIGNPDNKYPFGGFGRNGDILNVPFIAAYRIRIPPPAPNTPTAIFELNAITMDSAFADDTDPDDDALPGDTGLIPREQVGRFAPLFPGTNGQVSVPEYNDLRFDGTYDQTATTNKLQYRWALDLFDYLTVQSPGEDYFPAAPKTGNATSPFPSWSPSNSAGVTPQAIKNAGGAITAIEPANQLFEESVGIQGLININTAPWKVLAMVPWVPVLNGRVDNFTIQAGTDVAAAQNNIDDNEEIARAIVRWRDGEPASGTAPGGPFTTIYDLYKVPEFRSLNAALLVTDPDDAHGDASPAGIGQLDNVRYDFEEQYLLMNRVSNLITTRSDTFTVYIVIQGFRQGVFTPEVQRRAAFIIDRTPLEKPTNPATVAPRIFNVATD